MSTLALVLVIIALVLAVLAAFLPPYAIRLLAGGVTLIAVALLLPQFA